RDGSGLTQITDAPGREEDAPAWSPDGSKLAFLGCNNGDCDLIVHDSAPGGTETVLIHGGAGAPDWQAGPPPGPRQIDPHEITSNQRASPPIAVRLDPALGRVHQRVGEPHAASVDERDGHLAGTLGRPLPERVLGSDLRRLRRDATEVPVG